MQERPDPPVGPGEVRIAVRAAGINFADLMARVGLYPDAPKPPCVLGYEVAGEVESVGEGVEGHEVGDRVIAGTRFGGQAELVTVAAEQVYAAARGAQLRAGRRLPGQLRHRLRGARRDGRPRAGRAGPDPRRRRRRRHLRHPDRRIAGAEIFGTASASKHEAIRAQGVDHPIDYRDQDFEDEVMRITGGEGIDVAFDALGPDQLPQGLPAAAPGRAAGHVRLLGGQTGEKPRHPGDC